MSSPNLSELVATTIEARKNEIANNVLQHNAALNWISKKGNVVEFTGGTKIVEALSYSENSNARSYSGYEVLPTGAQDVLTAATYNICQYAVPVSFSGFEQFTNAGKAQIIDLIDARVANAEDSMANLLNTHIYLDGTGNGGKNITGLGAAVPLSATNTYGGIDRSAATNAFWKNQKFQASVDGTGVATSTTIQGYWNQFMISLTRGVDRPNVIITGGALYAIYQASLQTIQRITSSDTANAGFTAIEYQGIPVVFDTAASGITTTDAFFLNTKYFKWRPVADRNMVALNDRQSINQDATIKILAWAGNLTGSAPKFSGRFSNS